MDTNVSEKRADTIFRTVCNAHLEACLHAIVGRASQPVSCALFRCGSLLAAVSSKVTRISHSIKFRPFSRAVCRLVRATCGSAAWVSSAALLDIDPPCPNPRRSSWAPKQSVRNVVRQNWCLQFISPS